MITHENTFEVSAHVFTAEASDLRIAPGGWPKVIDSNIGNRMAFLLRQATAHKATYRQANGCLVLIIYND